MPGDPKKAKPAPEEKAPQQLSEAEALELLEKARQDVKQIAKRALEGETISADLLHMRLRNIR
jgi:hypothetical protein